MKLIDEIKILNTTDDEVNVNQSDRCFRERSMSSFINKASKKSTPICVLDLEPEIKLKLQLNNAIRINCADNTLIAIVVGLYHGTRVLCAKRSSNACVVRNGQIQFDELIEFDISVIDLPRMCRFSFMLFEIVTQSNKKCSNLYFNMSNNDGTLNASSNTIASNKTSTNCYLNNETYTLSSRRKITGANLPTLGIPIDALVAYSSNNPLLVNPLCWINLNLFDYNGQLRTEVITLPMWSYSELDNSSTQTNDTITLDELLTDINSFDENQWHDLEEETLLNPMGTVVWNPNKENATCLTCTFINYTNESNTSLFYPTIERIIEYYKSIHSEAEIEEEDDFLDCKTSSCKESDDFNVKELEELLMQKMMIADDLMINKNNSNMLHSNSVSMYDLNVLEDSKLLLIKNRKTTTKNGYQLLSHSTSHSSNSLTASKLISNSTANLTIKGRKASKAYLDQLKEICEKDPLNDLDAQDKELIWYLKEFCKKHIPNSLTHLLASVKWNKFKDQVLDLLVLINDWPLLPPEKGFYINF